MFKSTNGGGNWSAVNTGLNNTDVRTLVIDPATPVILYAGTYGGGMFKSTNGGGIWVNTGLTATIVYSLAIDPATPSTLYAGTNGSGVFMSTNGGGIWVNIGLANTDIHTLVIDPATPTTLYAGTGGGVFKSTNGGGNWSAVNIGLTSNNVYALAIDPATPSTLYAGTEGGGVFAIQFFNAAPVANAQSVTTAEDTAKAITLTATDADGDILTYSVVAAPSHGVLTGSAPALTYTPAANYNGPDSFTFKANDGTADSNIATVSITVTAMQQNYQIYLPIVLRGQ